MGLIPFIEKILIEVFTKAPSPSIVKNWLTFCLDNAIDEWLDQEIVDFERDEG